MKTLAAAIHLCIAVAAADVRGAAGAVTMIAPVVGFDGEGAPLRLERFLESSEPLPAVPAGSSYELLKRAVVMAREMPEFREKPAMAYPRFEALSSVIPSVIKSDLHPVYKAELLVMILKAARSLSEPYHKSELAASATTAMSQFQVAVVAVREEVLGAAADIYSAKALPDRSGNDWSWKYRAKDMGTMGIAMGRMHFPKEDISGLFKDALELIRASAASKAADSYWGTDYYPMTKAEALAEAALQMTKAGLGDAASGPIFDEARSVAGVIADPWRREETLKLILKKLTEAGEAR